MPTSAVVPAGAAHVSGDIGDELARRASNEAMWAADLADMEQMRARIKELELADGIHRAAETQARRALTCLQQHDSHLFCTMNQPAIVLTTEFQVSTVNPAAQEWFADPDAGNRTLQELLSADVASAIICECASLLREMKRGRTEPRRILTDDVRTGLAACTLVPLCRVPGVPERFTLLLELH